MSPKKQTQKTAKRATVTGKPLKGFTAEERAAMRERARELKAEARASQNRDAGEKAVLAATAKMPELDRTMAKRLHAIIKANAPELAPRTWYGMPAYAKDDRIVCFFRPAHKFKDRYATFGFNDKATLDEGAMWPTAFALKELTAEVEVKIGKLVKKAAG